MPLHVPNVTLHDLQAFHDAHFSSQSFPDAPAPNADGVGDAQENAALYKGVDDDLGRYEDGTPRTLTDDQIAMFRHSEVYALRREREEQARGEGEGAEGPSEGDESKNFGAETCRGFASRHDNSKRRKTAHGGFRGSKAKQQEEDEEEFTPRRIARELDIPTASGSGRSSEGGGMISTATLDYG